MSCQNFLETLETCYFLISRRSRAATTSTENETMTGNLNLKGTRAARRPKADGGKMGSAEEKELILHKLFLPQKYRVFLSDLRLKINYHVSNVTAAL